MWQWRAHELGDPIDVLRLDEVPEPVVAAGEIQVQVEATGLAFPDVLMCQGAYQVPTRLPFTPGGEWAGTVVAVGDGVERFTPGDRVVAMGGQGLSAMRTVRERSAWALPEGVDVVKAAAIPTNYGTTWYALHDRGQLRPGETLLVTGGAGGTGSAAIQLGVAAGARVIAVAGGAAKAALCETLGAQVVVDHQATPQWVDLVREATDGRGVDVAYDPVGGDTFHQVRRCMGWDGRLLVIGFVSGIADAPTNHVLLKNYSVVGVHWGASLARDPGTLERQMAAVFELAAAGKVDPPLTRFHTADAPRGLQDMLERAVTGKVVVVHHA